MNSQGCDAIIKYKDAESLLDKEPIEQWPIVFLLAFELASEISLVCYLSEELRYHCIVSPKIS